MFRGGSDTAAGHAALATRKEFWKCSAAQSAASSVTALPAPSTHCALASVYSPGSA